MENNENFEICSACNGNCCKSCSGIVFPEQLSSITKETILSLIKDKYCFDYWEGNPTNDMEHDFKTAYYIRPKHKDKLNEIIDPSWGGECVFLNNDGCSLKFEERPLQCQALIPAETNECDIKRGFEKKSGAIAWLPYNKIINEVIDELNMRY